MLLSGAMPQEDGEKFSKWAGARFLPGSDWRRTELKEKIAVRSQEFELPQGEEDVQAFERKANSILSTSSKLKTEDLVVERAIRYMRDCKIVRVATESPR